MSEFQIRTAVLEDAPVVFSFISSLMRSLDSTGSLLYEEAHLMPPILQYLSGDYGFYIFIAVDLKGRPQGVICLNECRAIYTLGAFGEITELYVTEEMRCKGLGAQLIKHAESFALSKGWSQIEVGTAELPKWQRTVDFYHRCGYDTIGPRLYKWINRPELRISHD